MHFSKWAELSGEKQEVNSFNDFLFSQDILSVSGVRLNKHFVNLFASLAYRCSISVMPFEHFECFMLLSVHSAVSVN